MTQNLQCEKSSKLTTTIDDRKIQSPLLIPEYCYNANPTLHSNSLWKNPKTISQAVALRDAWKLTLQNHGCSGLVNVS